MRPRALPLLLIPAAAVLLGGCPKPAEPAGDVSPAAAAADAPPRKGEGVVAADSVPMELKIKAANGWDGTYRSLLAVIHAPEDAASYTAFTEFGAKEAALYKDYGPQPAGWWVYVEPYWFIWDTRNGERSDVGPGQVIPSDGKLPAAGAGVRDGLVDPTTLPPAVKLRAALGRDAKYTNALAAIHDPADAKEFTPFSEYGWREVTNYKTYGQVPEGFWVYVEPYWVIWNLKDGQTGP